MKILFISYFNEWVTHFGTELELAQLHLDGGDTVAVLGCDGSIGACLRNATGAKRTCDECRLRRARGLNMLRPRVGEYRLEDYLPHDIAELEESIPDRVTDADSARSFRYRGLDLGWGALSSTIMRLRDPVCDSPEARVLLQRFTRTALRSYLAVRAFLEAHPHVDRVYIFNGRFACTRGAFRACEERGIADIMIHERGSSIYKYELFHNSMPHNRDWWQERIELAWTSSSDIADRAALGRSYFEARRRGEPSDWKSYIKEQDPGLLPETWDGARTNIGIFTSSEDEYAGIGDLWENRIYRAQSDGIQRLVIDAGARYPDMHFYVRMHPNLSGVSNKEVEKLRGIKSANLTLIEPESRVSTYALLDAVERVVTFGSTVGIEATFWGKVSILAGHALYEHLDVAHVAEDHEGLLELLGAELEARPILDTLKYGYCMSTFGIPFVYWQPNGFHDGRFRGRALKWSPTTSFVRRILMESFAEHQDHQPD